MKAPDRNGAILLVVAGVLALLVGGLVLLRDPGPGDLGTTATPSTPSAGRASGPPPPLPRPACGVSAILVPDCGRWWGVAPGALTDVTLKDALHDFEDKTGRPVDVVHAYHRDDTLFPTGPEMDLARDPQQRRLLFLNWKPSTTMTWREMADGGVDDRIDALAAHITSTFPERFFLTVWHEPENDVKPAEGSGMTATDYHDMYRHVVERLRAGGVTNAVTVMTYLGGPMYGVKPWFGDLYPGDDVVDWMGWDPYVFASPTANISGDFGSLVNRSGERWPGFYTWAQANHPGKPLVVAEWGVFTSKTQPERKAFVYESAQRQIADFPAIKAILYFDSPNAPKGDTRVDSSADALSAFDQLGREGAFVGPPVPAD